MKKELCFLLIIFSVVLTNCSVEKRLYRDGYNLGWNKKSETKIIQPISIVNQDKITASNNSFLSSSDFLSTKPIYVNQVIKDSCDIISLANNEKIYAEIVEVTESDITYKLCGGSNGDLRQLKLSSILDITYKNGVKESFQFKSKEDVGNYDVIISGKDSIKCIITEIKPTTILFRAFGNLTGNEKGIHKILVKQVVLGNGTKISLNELKKIQVSEKDRTVFYEKIKEKLTQISLELENEKSCHDVLTDGIDEYRGIVTEINERYVKLKLLNASVNEKDRYLRFSKSKISSIVFCGGLKVDNKSLLNANRKTTKRKDMLDPKYWNSNNFANEFIFLTNIQGRTDRIKCKITEINRDTIKYLVLSAHERTLFTANVKSMKKIVLNNGDILQEKEISGLSQKFVTNEEIYVYSKSKERKTLELAGITDKLRTYSLLSIIPIIGIIAIAQSFKYSQKRKKLLKENPNVEPDIERARKVFFIRTIGIIINLALILALVALVGAIIFYVGSGLYWF